MKVIEAPTPHRKSLVNQHLFLAGGITDCPNWHKEVISILEKADPKCIVFNPRRDDWPDDPAEVKKQIEWEYDQLNNADVILFWFPKETLCPITLYELGARLMFRKFWGNPEILIGCDPEYKRLEDVQIQSKLAGYRRKIYDNIEDLSKAVLSELRQ